LIHAKKFLSPVSLTSVHSISPNNLSVFGGKLNKSI